MLGDLNALHPFREGNGRTQRAFLTLLANDAGRGLHWADLDADENVRAFIAALTDETQLQGILARITVPLKRAQPHRQVQPHFPPPGPRRPPELGR